MADASTPPIGEPTPDPTPDPTPKTFTQDDLNRIVQERVAKERSRFGDYDALKEKAGKFDALEEASKTETQKLIDRVAELDVQIAQLSGHLCADIDVLLGLQLALRGDDLLEIASFHLCQRLGDGRISPPELHAIPCAGEDQQDEE